MAGECRAGLGVTAVHSRLGTDVWLRCHRAARDDGLSPGLTLLCSALLPGVPPCGPAGHAVLPADIASGTGRIWVDGLTFDAHGGHRALLGSFELPGGRLEALRWTTGPAVVETTEDVRAAWALGLVWLRLGLSEGLRDACVRYLRGRRSGESVLLQQQLVKGTLADALAGQLEIRAVLTGAEPGDLPEPIIEDLHDRVTAADRILLRLLGASSMLLGGPGEVAYVSELIADAYVTRERR
jgi:hypothetical protein